MILVKLALYSAVVSIGYVVLWLLAKDTAEALVVAFIAALLVPACVQRSKSPMQIRRP